MLDDREKLIVSSLYLMKNYATDLGSDATRSLMVEDLAKSFNLGLESYEFYGAIKRCEEYFLSTFTSFIIGGRDYDPNYLELSYREQLLVIILELLFVETTGVDQYVKEEYQAYITETLKITSIREILEMVTDQIDETDKYFIYWLKQKRKE